MAARTKQPPRICDALGCTTAVRRGILMCRPHWYQLPPPLRQAINQTWAARQYRAWSENCLEARRWHAANKSQALTDRMTGERT